ncbi:MAG: helix-turn-helix transcriptional regulator [Oscillospiraceae bacterium]|jgi:transcriptional regulator with XRE-family HTH domain|nr:helix-turn-helix transcriptional regulator [Oscillospiraceae bacterium]
MAKRKEKDPEAVAVGRRLKLARTMRKMTQEKLAEAADTSVQFLSQLENGEQTMTMIKFGRLATALRVSSDYLLFGRQGINDRAALAAEFMAGLAPIQRELLTQTMLDMGAMLEAVRPENEEYER